MSRTTSATSISTSWPAGASNAPPWFGAYGLRPDLRFPEYWQDSAGVIPERGVYLYFLASLNPVEQAANLFGLVDAARAGLPDQPGALDVEHDAVDGKTNHPGSLRTTS